MAVAPEMPVPIHVPTVDILPPGTRPVADLVLDGDAATLHLRGEIDLVTAPAFARAVRAAAAAGARRYVVDLHDVAFFDCAGIGVLADLLRRCPDVAVVGARPIVRTMLTITGLTITGDTAQLAD